MRIREIGSTLLPLLLLLVSLSCNEVAPTQGTGTGTDVKFPISLIPRVALNYPLAVGNYWIYSDMLIRTQLDSSGQVRFADTTSSIDTVTITDSIESPDGVWWRQIDSRYSNYTELLSRNDSVYIRVHSNTPNVPPEYQVGLMYIPPPCVLSVSFLSREVYGWDAAEKSVSLLDGPVLVPVGEFRRCARYYVLYAYDKFRTDGTTIVEPALGVVAVTAASWIVPLVSQVNSRLSKKLISYHLEN